MDWIKHLEFTWWLWHSCKTSAPFHEGCWLLLSRVAVSLSVLCPCRVFLALCEDPKDRGTIVAQGGGKVIAFMFEVPDVLLMSVGSLRCVSSEGR